MKSEILNLNIGLFVILTLFSRTLSAEKIKTNDKEFGYASGYSLNTGFIVIKSNPSGAEVYIGGKTTDKKTPFQMQLEAGTYHFLLKYPMYNDFEGDITIIAGQTITKEINLRPAFGSINVMSEPSGALITLDGISTNQITPYILERIPSGLHIISLSKDMYSNVSQRTEVINEQTSKVVLELQAGYGTIGIVSKPESAISIDGNFAAMGNYVGRLSPGVHLVEVTKDKYYSQKKEIKIASGQEQKLNFQLEPIIGSLSIMCEPLETEIYLNDKSYGLSPKIISDLIVGNYMLELKKEGYVKISKEITINENKSTIINEQLSQGINIRINTSPTEVALFLNGKNSNQLTPLTLFTKPGNYDIQLKKEYYNDINKNIAFLNDTSILFNLSPKTTTIQLFSTPSSADCIIDGMSIGKTPISYEIHQGSRHLIIEKEGYYPYDLVMNVGANSRGVSPILQHKYPNRASALALNLIWPGAGNAYLTGKKANSLIGVAFYGLLIPALIANNDSSVIALPAIMYYIFINPIMAFMPHKENFRNLPRRY